MLKLTNPRLPRIIQYGIMARFRSAIGLSLVTVSLLAGCRSREDMPTGERVQVTAPLGLPRVPVPHDNPPTAESVALGRKLFFDARLSRDNTVSCATCHDPAKAFADGRAVSIGAAHASGVRNAPTVLNAAYLSLQFWDGRAATLEEQAGNPMADHREMDQNHMLVVFRLNADPAYRAMAAKVFGSPTLTLARVEKAIASFERTLLSGDSAFDRYQYGGDTSALTPTQIRGLKVFLDPNRGNCAVCHTIGDHDALFTDGKFHNIGVGVRDDGTFADQGRYVQTHDARDIGSFRTPTLRNVELTAPYMHDGSEKTLRAVVDFYDGKGNSNPNLDPEMQKIHLTDQDRTDLVEFLKALTGTMPPIAPTPAQTRN